MVSGRPDAVPATSRTAVTPLAPNVGWPGESAAETRGGTAVTAEIPAVPVAPNYGVLLPDGSIWYPGSKRKLPAPTPLRIVVWVLALLVAIAGAGLIVEHYHASWVDPLRHVVATPGQPSTNVGGGGTATTTPTSSHGGSGKMQETSPNIFSVPASFYVLSIKTTARCYVVVKSLTKGTDLFDSTIDGGVTQSIFVPSGSATLEAYAGGSALSVFAHGRKVGAISDLVYAVVYTFHPSS